MTVSKELSKYKLHLVGIQEVRWDTDGPKPAGEYTFLYEKWDENHELGTDSPVHKRILSALKEEFASDRMLYMI
jgi:hypothetical protein